MSQSDDPFASGDRFAIRREVTRQFLRGGGTGIAAFVGVGVFIYVLMLVSWALPPESKEADDPTPDSFPALVAQQEAEAAAAAAAEAEAEAEAEGAAEGAEGASDG